MKFRFKASRTFWKAFTKLPERQQASAKAAFKIFKANPFDPRLRAQNQQLVGLLRQNHLRGGD